MSGMRDEPRTVSVVGAGRATTSPDVAILTPGDEADALHRAREAAMQDARAKAAHYAALAGAMLADVHQHRRG